MKTFPGFTWCSERPLKRRGIFWLALVLGAAAFIAGCGKAKAPVSKPFDAASNQASATNQTDQTQALAATQTPANSQTPTVAPATTPAGGPDLTAINRVMFRFFVSHHRKPANFGEFSDFAASVNFPIPPPPPGKKYAINASGIHVDLVNQ